MYTHKYIHVYFYIYFNISFSLSRDLSPYLSLSLFLSAYVPVCMHESYKRIQIYTPKMYIYFHMWDTTLTYMFISIYIYMCDIYMRHDSFTCATWLINTWDVTHSHVWHDSFICVTILVQIGKGGAPVPVKILIYIYMWDLTHLYYMTHSYRQGSHMCDIRTCDMTHSHVGHDSLIRAPILVQMNRKGRSTSTCRS